MLGSDADLILITWDVLWFEHIVQRFTILSVLNQSLEFQRVIMDNLGICLSVQINVENSTILKYSTCLNCVHAKKDIFWV